MAFTYDATLATNLSKVRFLVPDTDSTAYDLADAEIEYMLDRVGHNVTEAAAQCCEQVSRNYAVRGMKEKSGVFAARAKELRASVPSAGASAVTMTKSDGYSETNVASEYQRRTYRWWWKRD